MGQKFYQKVTVQVAIVTGVFMVLVAILSNRPWVCADNNRQKEIIIKVYDKKIMEAIEGALVALQPLGVDGFTRLLQNRGREALD